MRGMLVMILMTLGWALIATTGVAVWLHYFRSQGEIAVQLTSLVPLAVGAGIVALLIALGLRRWFMVAFAVIATVAVGWTQAPLFVADAVPSGERFTVVSANLMLGSADAQRLSSVVVNANAQVLTVQELTPEALDSIRRSAMVDLLPYEYVRPEPGARGSAIFSATPLTDTAEIDDMYFVNPTARTELPGAGETVIVSPHPTPPVDGGADRWISEIERLAAYLDALPDGPAIIAGDFNTTWDSAHYRDLLGDDFRDAFDSAGAGILPTYPTDKFGGRPVVAIDRVILRGFVATDAHTVTLDGSDHRALVVSVVPS